ncbi:MAG: phage head-tail connector protein [Lachnospiraceae bacterium]|nr:phage head-tail connector protein [Lachnospiraceae bacterium]
MIDTDETLRKIKVKQGIPEENTDNDAILLLMISDAMDAVCAYCHRKRCPDGLEYLVRELVINAVAADNVGSVASIKRGDTQINYNTSITTDFCTDRQIRALNSFRILKIG